MQGYSYAGNSPVTSSDPSGLMACATPVECGGGAQYGNNTPTKHSHGKPLNDKSWGCNGCDNDSYDDGWWSVSGWSQAEGGPELTPGRITIFPGVSVPDDWGNAKALKKALNNQLQPPSIPWMQQICNVGCWANMATNPEDADQLGAVQRKLALALFHACKAGRDCPNGMVSLSSALAAASVTALNQGGGGKGPRGVRPPSTSGALRKECNSFVGGTEVLLADGTSKPIEDLKIGDKVLATDPETGETKAEMVTAEIIGKGEKHLVKITVDLDGKKGTKAATITATDGHPFWVAELKQWIDATQLHEGDWLRTSAGTRVQVTAVERWTQRATVHNLTVTDLHTYYVLAGRTPVLVHNSNCSIGSVTGPAGEVLPLPKGAAGTPVATGKGWAYDIPAGTKGLDPRVVQVRVMDPVTTGKYQYPNGYVVYMNKAGQSVNPLTGQTVSKADPYNHIPIP